MRCPKCGFENRDDAHFCHRCGAPLAAPEGPRHSTRPLPQSADASLPETRPLPGATVAFAALPEGALLGDGRYVVLEVRATSDRLNVYLVEDTTPVRLCPNCHAETADPEEQFCAFCGADLSHVGPLYLRYVVRESAGGQAFAVEARLLEMGLDHPGLLLPRAVFAEAPYGPPRHYLVEPEFPPSSAASLPTPQEPHLVLQWGISLAQALDYLHRHQVTLRGVSLERIAVEGGHAYWTSLGMAYIVPPEARSQVAGFVAQDVRGLAAALFRLATGRPQYTPQAALPEPVAALFAQALASPSGFADAATFGAALEAALQTLRRPPSVTFAVGHRTDVGRERSLNEDSLLTLDMAVVFRSVGVPVGLFAVADGMGGHQAGDVASRVAIGAVARLAVGEVLTPAAAGEELPDAREWLAVAIEAANQAVYERRKAAGTDMGTTLVMALVVGDTATIANVGDSRAYLLGQDGIAQLTTDHSLVERLVATGQITREEAAVHPQKNVIYRVIGDRPQVEVDLFERRLAPGEALLLCSDGLSGMVPDEQIWQIWRTSTSPQEACDRLVEAANEAGGEDNITAVLVQIGR